MEEQILEETRFGIKHVVHGGKTVDCSDQLCTRKITVGNECYLDLLKNGEALCSGCGKCLRYARKKAQGRGEPIESAEV